MLLAHKIELQPNEAQYLNKKAYAQQDIATINCYWQKIR
jgi:hypothetical protein